MPYCRLCAYYIRSGTIKIVCMQTDRQNRVDVSTGSGTLRKNAKMRPFQISGNRRNRLASPARFERAAFRLGVWHTTSYGIMPDDFQYLKNLETTGFFGRSPYYSVPSGTTLFLLILYRPISKLLASQGSNSSQRCSDTLCKSIMIGGWEVNPQT